MDEKIKRSKNKSVHKLYDAKKDSSSDSCNTKKAPMKTCSDVISRILWDDSLDQNKFTVGYLDRFDGIVEKPFTHLDWNDPAAVDNYALALPKHRIQYFKYNNKKVWDKTIRKDIVFGSTGFPLSIHEFMARVDQEKEDFNDEGIIMHVGDTISENSTLKNFDIDNEDFDSSTRANFFVAAKISSENTVKNLKEVADYIKSTDEFLNDCCIPPEKLHLTLCILRLESARDIINAIAAIKSVASQNLPVVTINLEGLDNFHHRVLYSCIEENDNLLNLRQHLVDALDDSTVTDKFSFVPHVTIAKLSRPVARLRHSNYIDQYLYLKFEDNNFGSEIITDLYLCEMGSAVRSDGFYKCACEVSLDQSTDL